MIGTAMNVFQIRGQSRGRYSEGRKAELIASGQHTEKDFRPEYYFTIPCPADKTLPLIIEGGKKIRIYVIGSKGWTDDRKIFEAWKNRDEKDKNLDGRVFLARLEA